MKVSLRSEGVHKLSKLSRIISAVLLFCLLALNVTGCNKPHTEPSSTVIDSTTVTLPDSDVPPESVVTESTAGTDGLSGGVPSVSLSLEDRFNQELSLIPFEHLQFLKLNGWKIEMTSMDLAAEYEYSGQICGITVYNDKLIYISASEYAIRRSTIHEIGHAIGCQLGWVEETDEFVEIYQTEKSNFHDCCSIGDGHETSDKYEYFASVYQNMILNYEQTKNDVPLTVEYIENCLSRITIFNDYDFSTNHIEGQSVRIM